MGNVSKLLLIVLLSASMVAKEENNTTIGKTKLTWLDRFSKDESVLKNMVSKQIDKINDIANNTKSKNEKNLKGFVLSTEIPSFNDIPSSIDFDIKTTKKEVATLIRLVATDIELNQKQYSGILTLHENGEVTYKPTKDLPEKLDNKRKTLLESNMQNGVAVKSAAIALKLLSDINNAIIDKAKKATKRQEKEKLFMKQAIYVYEMSDIVLSLLKSLNLEGVSAIKNMYEDTKRRVEDNVNKIEKSKRTAKALNAEGMLNDDKLSKELESLDLMKQARGKTLIAWDGVFELIGNQEKFLENLKKKQKLVAYKQEKAKLQIETLRDIRSVAALKSMIGSIDELVDNIDKLDLLVLDERTVSELLGLGEE